jgi:hypothetical protein
MKCTWKDCKLEATHSQLDNNGKEWANLCDTHHKELDDSLNELSPKKILRSWILASGGSHKMVYG